jgi:predicted transcriptional regulator
VRHQAGARPALAAAHQRQQPCVIKQALDQQLDPATAGLASEDACRDHPRVVEHQQVAGAQTLRQIGDGGIRDGATVAIQAQQATRAALDEWGLGDQRGRQFVSEVGTAHGARW